MPPRISAARFIFLCMQTFGEGWSYELSQRTNINARTLERMGSGKREIPEAVEDLVLTLHEHREFWRKGMRA